MDPDLAGGDLGGPLLEFPERNVHGPVQVTPLPFVRPPDVQDHRSGPIPFGGERAEIGHPVAGDLPVGSERLGRASGRRGKNGTTAKCLALSLLGDSRNQANGNAIPRMTFGFE